MSLHVFSSCVIWCYKIVPCLGIAFEYQGIQHYQPVELFGGKEHFEKGIELDKKKRLLCKEHGIIVIDWRYDEPITTAMLKRKLKNIAEGP
ncbi:MAG: hypothetical protein K0R21_1367 [Anaerocolumna sp.]|nr:hypothetical protein [Anaerocolumna sp.]